MSWRAVVSRAVEFTAAVACVAAVFLLGFAVRGALDAPPADAALDRAEAKATFDAPDQVSVEFPSLVRGRIVKCHVFANTKRRALAVFC